MLGQLPGILVTAFVVGLSGALMPGPLTTLTIARTAERGFGEAPLVATGHAVVEVAAVAGLFFGLGQVLQRGGVQGAIGVVGGLSLIWMGWSMAAAVWRGQVSLTTVVHQAADGAVAGNLPEVAGLDTPALTPAGPVGGIASDAEPTAVAAAAVLERAANPAGQGPAALFRSTLVLGGAVSVSNAYWLLWWATVGAAYVSTSLGAGPIGVVTFYFGHILSDFAWLLLLGGLVVSGRRFLSQGVYRGVLLACSAALILLGARFIVLQGPNLVRALGG